jgi:type VI secretion system secreted protein Hcp
MLRKFVAAPLALMLVLSTSTADAAMQAYLYLKGQKSGQIKGSITQKGREDSIGVIAVEHDLRIPPERAADPGARRHAVFKITKELDKSTPVLYSAMTNGEVLTEATLRYWTPQIRAATGVGAEVQHFTVKLTNARIVEIKHVMQNIRHPDLQKYTESEEVSFVYDKIEWTWVEGGITAADQAKF